MESSSSLLAKTSDVLVVTLLIFLIVESCFWVLVGLLDLGMPVSEEHARVFSVLAVLECFSIFAFYSIIRKKRLGLPVYAACTIIPYVLAYYWNFTIGLYTFITFMLVFSIMVIGGKNAYFNRIYMGT